MTLVLLLLSVIAAALPMLAFLGIVWWLDHNSRQPLWLLTLVFAWGALGATSLSLAGNNVLQVVFVGLAGEAHAEALGAVVGAPLVEEPLKALVFLPLAWTRHFEKSSSGFVYGAAVGLGFGMTENALYFTSAAGAGVGSWMYLVLVRTFFSAVLHAVASSMLGASIAAARFRPRGIRLLATGLGAVAAMGLHALWNGLATAAQLTGEERFGAMGFGAIALALALVTLVFQAALWQERSIMARELSEESRLGTLPEGHAAAIGSFWRRRQVDWLPKGVPAHAYIRAASSLALRRHAARVAASHERSLHEDDAERLRREVRALLALAR